MLMISVQANKAFHPKSKGKKYHPYSLGGVHILAFIHQIYAPLHMPRLFPLPREGEGLLGSYFHGVMWTVIISVFVSPATFELSPHSQTAPLP